MNSTAEPYRILMHPSAKRAQKLSHLRALARTMDTAILIPGTNIRIGLDGFIGLIPGIGDFAGLVIASYFIFVAAQLQVPKIVLARMGWNILVDSVVGSIPFFGDLFDFAWNANRMNLELLERHMVDPRRVKQNSILFMLAVGAIIVGALVCLFFVLRWLAAVIYALIAGWLPSVN